MPYKVIMKQVNSSTSGILWDENQKSPYYNYKVRLFTSYEHLFLLVFEVAYCIFDMENFYQFSFKIPHTDCCLKILFI